ncbi:NAD-dependent epimerase/dehydratase family protein [Phycisphaera mikurensis]|uniref:NAD-dependent epimerase/dehydratase family protein n=1 Tax=Phycisphaera mikurensis (strain NBRC 102666 / KCTC 22515 / FYK2301M01) TaxID=1142394 RepID=I0IBB8_PHYMF|nr:NAD(P)-dependent oxidoreductase [Phycisphaera mikurensis]MBB6443050.1 nucleoside-diphosphate-sugar epimerase [Phycisphaera mikurensis]BAM02556.1 NAD-dependent epimerase/dehydratase family protein [Phycisphaera mikurensis NBRC 102666]
MKILLTGASSFTGAHYAATLAARGHEVTATFTRGEGDYADGGVRQDRVARVTGCAKPLWNASFGDDRFTDTLASGGFDALCHHAADVTDYKSPAFDAAGAIANNTRNAHAVLASVAADGGVLMLTGSVFAGGRGAGSDGLPHFSPYGLSKGLSNELLAYLAAAAGVPCGEVVIPNPFGPLEEPRFTAYLVKTWMKEEAAGCNTPLYVRDNLHVGLLALAYADAVERLAARRPAFERLEPSGYIESQGAFAQRYAREMSGRLGKPCVLNLADQTAFSEPRIRVNTDPLDEAALGFDEAAAWDEAAADYLRRLG